MNTSHESQPTDYPLPKLTSEVIDSLHGDVAELGAKAVFKQARDRLSTNNTALYEAVGSFAFGALGPKPDQATINVVHDVMIMTHELLRRQAEADAFGAAFPTPPEVQ